MGCVKAEILESGDSTGWKWNEDMKKIMEDNKWKSEPYILEPCSIEVNDKSGMCYICSKGLWSLKYSIAQGETQYRRKIFAKELQQYGAP